MIVKFLGWVWLIFAILFFLKPQWLKAKLQKKTLKTLKKYLFILAIFLGLWLIVAAFKIDAAWSKLFMALGIIAIIKGIFFLKAKAADKILEWFAAKPRGFYRIIAAIHIIIAIIILRV